MRLLVLGGGQLALMMCWEAQRLPIRFSVYDGDKAAPAFRCATPAEDVFSEIERSDAVTFEFENVDISAAEYAERLGKLRPALQYLLVKKSRIEERKFFESLGVPTIPWRRARGGEEALKIAEAMGKAMVKVPTGGYDGKGQYVFPREARAIAGLSGDLLVEEYVDIRREFSLVAVRSEDGDIYFYPPAQNYYVDGILVWNYAPTSAPQEAYEYASRVLERWRYVGVLAIEFFETADGRILANEIAPRVHNTAHWTLETDASQFENHVRAVLGLPIRRLEATKPVAMVNILGVAYGELPVRELEALGKIYWYGKAEVRPRRKMGHVNLTGSTVGEVVDKARRALSMIYGRDFPKRVMRSVSRGIDYLATSLSAQPTSTSTG
ncbi:MAG: 5-(carboxyamino)imidazole ribonucleotide synthase [Thermoproteus sp.]